MEYVGEVITSEEAERRGQFYDNKGITYLFDLTTSLMSSQWMQLDMETYPIL